MSNYFLDKKEREMRETKKTPEIFEYIKRNRNGKKCKVGMVVGKFVDRKIFVGWSKVNIKSGDKFSFDKGIDLARNRMCLFELSNAIPTPTPADIRKQLRKFSSRCVRYFKGATELHMPV